MTFVLIVSSFDGDGKTDSSGEVREMGNRGLGWGRAAALWMALLVVLSIGVSCGGEGTDGPSTEAPSGIERLVVPVGMGADQLELLLPSAEEAGVFLGSSIEVVTEVDLGQTFEHTDIEQLIGARVSRYQAVGLNGSGSVQLALYESAVGARAAFGVILEESEDAPERAPDLYRSEFRVSDLADEGRGLVIDAEVDSSFTWALLRFDRLLVEIVVFNPAGGDQVDAVIGLAKLVGAALAAAQAQS